MAGRGTDIILGGNSDYMARLKLKEILVPLLVKPDNEHKPPIPQQRKSNNGGGFSKKVSGSKKNVLHSASNLYPCKLGEDIDKKLSLLSSELVKSWGDKTLTVLQLEDKIATAAEKAPTEDKLIELLRDSLSDVKRNMKKY